ncbi:MAG: S-layer homology domain-containing protein [Oscillospiraceae bacterium]|nr:S-layer homology domain-containing protein [Oscillospiraceae bacterium]
MKRILSILLTAALLAGLCLTASADTQPMLQTVRERIGDTSEYTEFSSNAWTDGGKTQYSFYWSAEDPYRSLNVTITDSGIITSYDTYNENDWNYDDTPTLNRPSQDEAKKNAEAFLAKIDPALAPELELTAERDGLRSRNYSFRVQRIHDGVPVYGDSGWLSMAQDGVRVQNFNLNWTEGLTFEPVSGTITQEAAQTAFAQKLGMRLFYRMDYSEKTPVVKLTYRPDFDYGEYISAKTGEVFTVKYPGGDGVYKYGRNAAMTEEAADSGSGFTGFTEIEQAELDNLAGLLSKEEEEKLLRANKLLTLDGMELSYHRRGKDYRSGIYCDTLSFEGKTRSAYLTVNAADGQVLSYYFYHDSGDSVGKPVTDAQAKTLAASAAKELAGELLAQYREEEAYDSGVYYVRYVNDVPFEQDTVYAVVEKESGRLESYSIGYTEAEFPSPAGVLTSDEAAAAMFRQVDYSLTFVPTAEGGKDYDRAALVYAIDSDSYSLRFDAFTGELLWRDTGTKELPEYTDISGHYAETAINALREYGVGFDSAEYRPDDTITQGEYLELLSGVFYGYDVIILRADADHSDTCKEAVRRGIIKESEIDADAPLTREMSAVMLIRAMGLDAVASLPGIFVSPFADVAGEHTGHIAILSGMGVFRGDGKGNFLPAQNLTRGQAAIVLYQYLTK